MLAAGVLSYLAGHYLQLLLGGVDPQQPHQVPQLLGGHQPCVLRVELVEGLLVLQDVFLLEYPLIVAHVGEDADSELLLIMPVLTRVIMIRIKISSQQI